jgi:hypothetical protein
MEIERDNMLSFKEAAALCKTSYTTIWRLARERGKLTSIRSYGVLRVDHTEIWKELSRNVIVYPGGAVPRVILEPDIWITIKEAAGELGATYHQIYHHLNDFTRTSFYGKVLIYKEDLNKGIHHKRDPSRALKEHETARDGLRL